MKEKWRTIAGFSDFQVSNHGRVQNVRTGSLLNPGHKRGMWVVSFRDDHGRQTTHNVGHWVLLAFVGPRPSPGHVTSHLDGDHGNNQVGNLAWETYLQNSARKAEHGTEQNKVRGSAHHKAVLTEEDVIDIRRELAAGAVGAQLAREYGVSSALISAIRQRRIWKHV